MAFPSYSTGTVAIAANATSVIGAGSNWSGQNAMPGDLLVVAGNTVIVQDVTDALHLAIDAWPYAAVTAASYKLYKVSPLRFAGGQAMAAVDTLVAALNTSGFYVFVGPTETVPDPSLGDNSQYALQATTGKLWQKTGGTWNFIGVQKGFGLPAPWNSATAYNAFDTVSLAGTSYVCILANTNQTPPNATYWTVLAAKGDGATIAVGTVTTGAGGSAATVTNSGTSGDAVLDFEIPQGKSYSCTSATSFAIATGSKIFATQAGLAWLPGARARVSSLAGGGVNYVEGVVTAYSGTTLTVNVSKVVGSGTHTDWQISLAGDPGSGDLLSTNNLSDLASAGTARGNLGVSAVLTGDRLAKAAAYTVASGDIGSTIALGGAAFYALTFNAASGYTAPWKVRVLNEDTIRGKLIACNGLSSFILWPGQSVVIENQNNVWRVHERQRWKVPSPVTLFVDTAGNDANDGLASGSGAFATLQAAAAAVWYQIDNGGMLPTISPTAGQTFAQQLNLGGQPLGTNLCQIQGNGGAFSWQTPSGGGTMLAVGDHAQVTLRDINFISSNNVIGEAAIYLHNDGLADINSGMTFLGGGTNDSALYLDNSGCICTISNGFGVSNTFGDVIHLDDGSLSISGPITPSGATVATRLLYARYGGRISCGPITSTGWSSIGPSLADKRGTIDTNGVSLPGGTPTTSASGLIF
jgi:hypothetical protein